MALLSEEAPDLGTSAFTCVEEGCGREFKTKALLGVHRWNAHRLRAPKAGPKGRRAPAKAAPAAKKESAPKVAPERKAPRKEAVGIWATAWQIAAELFVPKVSPAAAVAL